jgi:hypothetical protein
MYSFPLHFFLFKVEILRVIKMSSFYVSVNTRGRILTLHAPAGWTVGRLKELILLYHPEAPAIRAQVLRLNGEVLQNAEDLSQVFKTEQKQELELTIEQAQPIAENFTGFGSELFRTREEEYIHKYNIAKQLLLDIHHKAQENSVIPNQSVLNTLPVLHPDTGRRVKAMAQAERPRKVRLRKVPWAVYFDFATIFRYAFITVVARIAMESRLPKIYYAFMVLCYVVNMRFKIEAHREKELKKIPRDVLMKILPERFYDERMGRQRGGLLVVIYESCRGLVFSFLPWFDPVKYANERSQVVG